MRFLILYGSFHAVVTADMGAYMDCPSFREIAGPMPRILRELPRFALGPKLNLWNDIFYKGIRPWLIEMMHAKESIKRSRYRRSNTSCGCS